MNKTFENLKTYAKEISDFLREYNIENFYKKDDKFNLELIIEDAKKLIEHNFKIEVAYIEHTTKEEIELKRIENAISKKEFEKSIDEKDKEKNKKIEENNKKEDEKLANIIKTLEETKSQNIKKKEEEKEKTLKGFKEKLNSDEKSFKNESNVNINEEIKKLVDNFATLHKDEYDKIMHNKPTTATTTTTTAAAPAKTTVGGGATNGGGKGAPAKKGGRAPVKGKGTMRKPAAKKQAAKKQTKKQVKKAAKKQTK